MMIKEMRRALDKREISAGELASESLKKISAADDKIGACLHVDETLTIKMAELAQKTIDRGEASLLTGIPVGLKDNLCTTDMPTTCASKILEGYMSPYDATVVSRLRRQGAVFVAKLNMDEFAMGSTTMTSAYKTAKNPFDLSRVPGGSSGGSAAAVSAGYCASALGSDTGGSVRQPAAFCGVTGLRPTYGMVPRYGCVAFASSLDQVGPIAKSAEDCGIMLDAIAGHDPRDMTSAKNITERAAIDSVKGLRIGIIDELMGAEIDTEVKTAVDAAAKWFENHGAGVSRVSLPMLKYGVPAYFLISSAEASANLSRFDGVRYGFRTQNAEEFSALVEKSRAEGFGREVKRRILLGTYALCSGYYDAYYKKAVHLSTLIKEEYRSAFGGFDLLLSPSNPTPAYSINNLPTDPAVAYIADICTVSAALAGLPSLSTTCGYTDSGLPIGLMITGDYFCDRFILSAASLFESEFKRREPEVTL